MSVTPYYLLSGTTLSLLAERLGQACATWAADWGVGSVPPIEVVRAWDLAAPHALAWQRRYRDRESEVWLAWSAAWSSTLQGSVFGPDQRHAPHGASALVQRAATSATEALADALAQAAGVQVAGRAQDLGNAPDAALFRRGSGAIALDLQLGDQRLRCVINHACVATLAPPAVTSAAPASKTELKALLGHVPLSLSVTVGAAQVDVANLLTLALGDVIRLDTAVDRPVSINGPHGNILFGGHLGTLDGHIAIEVTRELPHPTPHK